MTQTEKTTCASCDYVGKCAYFSFYVPEEFLPSGCPRNGWNDVYSIDTVEYLKQTEYQEKTNEIKNR